MLEKTFGTVPEPGWLSLTGSDFRDAFFKGEKVLITVSRGLAGNQSEELLKNSVGITSYGLPFGTNYFCFRQILLYFFIASRRTGIRKMYCNPSLDIKQPDYYEVNFIIVLTILKYGS